MKYGLQESVIRKINKVFDNHKKVTTAILFGSRAKETYHAGSDIDLALTGQGLTIQDILQIKLQIEELNLPYEIDISILKQISSVDLIEHINRVGIIFYKK